MARYTVTNLRALVKDANEQYPLTEKNGYGNFDRFVVDSAYGKFEVNELSPGSTGRSDITYLGSARECAIKFMDYLMRNF